MEMKNVENDCHKGKHIFSIWFRCKCLRPERRLQILLNNNGEAPDFLWCKLQNNKKQMLCKYARINISLSASFSRYFNAVPMDSIQMAAAMVLRRPYVIFLWRLLET